MTIEATTNRVSYLGNGVTTAFAFAYPFHNQADLVVIETIAATGAQTTKTLTTDYTISGTADAQGHYPDGGTINAVTAPASTVSWTIYRDPSPVQRLDLVQNDDLPAESVESALDYHTLLNQRTRDMITRSLRQPEGDSAAIDRLPPLVDRISKYLAFDASGDPIAVDPATASGTSVTTTGTSTARLLADRFADWVNPLDYGAVGDGVTDDTTAVAAAVAYAYTNEVPIYWPSAIFLTTASIDNLHDVRHVGTGAIKRGSALFYVDPARAPGTTNNLYVATTGDDANDGLSSSEPRLTVQSMGNVIYGYAYGDVTWKINIAAGTYVASTSFSKPFPTPNRVHFLGAAKNDGTEPTTIFQSPGGSGKYGLYFQHLAYVWIEDIKVIDYNVSGTPSASGLGYGVFAGDHSDLYTKNVWGDNCDCCIGVWHLSKGRIQAGILRDSGNGIIALSNVVLTTGYGGTAADITGTTGVAIIDCEVGVNARENVAAHVDYTYFSGITNMALYISQQSRCNNVSSTYDTCNVGVRAETNSYWYENPGDENTFTACTTDLLIRSGSLTGGTNAGADWYGPALVDNDTGFYSTSSATPVTIYTRTFIAKEVTTRGRGFTLTLWGDVNGVANTKTVTVTLGATTLLTATIAASTTDYKIVVDLVQRTSTGSPSQRVLTEIYENGVLPVINYTNTAIDMAADIDLVVKHQVTNVADANRISNIRCEVVH